MNLVISKSNKEWAATVTVSIGVQFLCGSSAIAQIEVNGDAQLYEHVVLEMDRYMIMPSSKEQIAQASQQANGQPRKQSSETLELNLPADFKSMTIEDKSRFFNKEGANLLSRGKAAEAGEMFRKAIQWNPHSAAAHNNLALILKELGQLPEAEKEATQAIKIKADKSNYHYNLGLILQRQNKNQDAVPSFKEAVKLDPMDPDAHFRLAQSLLNLSRSPEAEEEVKLAILMKPNEASYHKLLADILLDLKKYDASLIEYRSAVELDPSGRNSGDIKVKIDYLKQVLKLK